MMQLMIVAQVLLAIGYAVLAWLDRPASGEETRNARSPVYGGALCVAVAVHGLILWRLLFQADGVNLSFAVSLSLIGFLLALALAASVILMPLPGMASRTLPLVAAVAFLPVVLRAPHWLSYSTDF